MRLPLREVVKHSPGVQQNQLLLIQRSHLQDVIRVFAHSFGLAKMFLLRVQTIRHFSTLNTRPVCQTLSFSFLGSCFQGLVGAVRWLLLLPPLYTNLGLCDLVMQIQTESLSPWPSSQRLVINDTGFLCSRHFLQQVRDRVLMNPKPVHSSHFSVLVISFLQLVLHHNLASPNGFCMLWIAGSTQMISLVANI